MGICVFVLVNELLVCIYFSTEEQFTFPGMKLSRESYIVGWYCQLIIEFAYLHWLDSGFLNKSTRKHLPKAIHNVSLNLRIIRCESKNFISGHFFTAQSYELHSFAALQLCETMHFCLASATQ